MAALEVVVARLKRKIRTQLLANHKGWQRICGTFTNDPHYEEAMRLGREYRESLREDPQD